MEHVNEPTHDEINLVRLLRRLEKSTTDREEWKASVAQPVEEVWLKAQKTSQKVKFARRLVKTIQLESEETPKRLKRINDSKIQLDRIELFLKDVEQFSKPKPAKRRSLLANLPLPKPTPGEKKLSLPISGPSSPDFQDRSLSLPPDSGRTDTQRTATPSTGISTKGLFITPPEPEEVSPSLISTALPSLLPINPSETAASSAFSRSFGGTAASRRLGGISSTNTGGQATTALQEELSSQLEQMAKQLKRNAVHFSTSLANDKAVMDDAQQKLESNFDVMSTQRVKLRDRSSKSLSNTCLTFGIILLVLLLFMVMVGVIRFSRI